jgi:cyclic nucleotide gated channel, plant
MVKQAAGSCWYLLGLQRAAKCLEEQCETTPGCGLRTLCCKEPIYYGNYNMLKKLDRTRLVWSQNTEARSTCLASADNYEFGVYEWSVQLVTNNSRIEKILLPIFWGLMTLRYFLITLSTS